MTLNLTFNAFWSLGALLLLLFVCLQNEEVVPCDQGSIVFRHVNFWRRIYGLNPYSSSLPVNCGHLTGLLEGMN